ncbi:RNA polymerase sigma factor [Roseivirga echinicomitans]
MPIENEAFTVLIEDNKGLIYKVANAYCKDAEDRKDLVQEIIIHLWKGSDQYDDAFKISTWIYRISLNVAISFYRKDRNRKATQTSISDGIFNLKEEESSNELESNLTLLQQFISELKELDRALMLLYLEQKTHKEMAEILGLSESNIATKISRIREKLRIRFSQHNA